MTTKNQNRKTESWLEAIANLGKADDVNMILIEPVVSFFSETEQEQAGSRSG